MNTRRSTAREIIRVGGLRGEEGSKEIEHNLIQVDGIRDVSVSLERDSVVVDYDPEVTSGEYIRRTLDSLGYSPYVRD